MGCGSLIGIFFLAYLGIGLAAVMPILEKPVIPLYVWAVSLLHILLGLTLYFQRGGSLLTPTGLFGFASSLFIGLPPIWYNATGIPLDALDARVSALGLLSISVATLTTLFVSRQQPRRAHLSGLHHASSRTLLAMHLGVIAVCFVDLLLEVRNVPMAGNLSYAGFILATLISIALYQKQRIGECIIAASLTLGALAFYATSVFSGYGRLKLVTLGMSVLLVTAIVTRARWLKIVPFLAAAPFLVMTGRLRSTAEVSLIGVLQDPRLGGVSSMLAPYTTLRDIIDRFALVAPFQLGKTYIATILFWVPRELWASKPYGLGYQYTLWLAPHLASARHSMAGSYLGELFVNFSYFGLIAGPVLIGIFLGCLDNLVVKLAGSSSKSTMGLLGKIVLVTVIAGSTLDYVWADTFTAAARAGSRLITTLPFVFGYFLVRFLTIRATGRYHVKKRFT